MKKNKKNNFGFCFLIFLCIGFSYTFITKVHAIGLEIQYPSISGQNINADTTLTIAKYLKYLFDAGMFLGFFSVFISLAIAGAMYFFSPIKADLLTSAKDRIGGAISGLLILLLVYLIITTINPNLKFFHMDELSALPSTYCTSDYKCMNADATHPADSSGCSNIGTDDQKCHPPGVYFYKSPSCDDHDVAPNISGVADFAELKNEINGVKIVQGEGNPNPFVSIIYENPNFWGKCQYINPNEENCQTVDPFANSASIYRYDRDPNGDGVYFFRKSCFNSPFPNQQTYDLDGLVNYCKENSGGWYKVENEDIKGTEVENKKLYVGTLAELKFEDVPEEEKLCTKYSKNQKCEERTPQNLGGENISSILIKGSYVVMFVYTKPGDTEAGPWTSCQEFPTPSDVNKIGPQQIKWQNIRNSKGVIPTYVVIFPIVHPTPSATPPPPPTTPPA
jgi:hypothetical protein